MAEHTTITPSGYEIQFEDGAEDENGHSKRRAYTVDGERLPSVTTVLNVLSKDGLQYGAEKETVRACIELAKEGELPSYVDAALSRMKARKLRFYQRWNEKKDRGTSTHDDLLALATGQPLTDLSDHPQEVRGVLKSVAGWYADEQPEVIDSELLVASKRYGYAGRLDLRCKLGGRTYLLDLKTTDELPRNKNGTVKPPYDESIAQLAAYELAAVESGYGSSDAQAILRVDSTGARDFHVTVTSPRIYLAALSLYRALRGLPEPADQLRLAEAA